MYLKIKLPFFFVKRDSYRMAAAKWYEFSLTQLKCGFYFMFCSMLFLTFHLLSKFYSTFINYLVMLHYHYVLLFTKLYLKMILCPRKKALS